MSSADLSVSRWARLFDCAHPEALNDELSALGVAGSDAVGVRAAWEAHRASQARFDARLDARVRDLEALSGFGRALADARSRDELLDRAAESLSGLIGADAVAWAGLADGLPDIRF